MFRGNHPATVDEKGRLKLPAAFKQLLEAQGVKAFYITSQDGKSAEIWPMPAWEAQEAKLEAFGSKNPSVARYFDQTSFYGQEAEIDGQGRLLLPQLLRNKAALKGEVAVIGKPEYLEVANQAQKEQQLAQQAITEEDRQLLWEITRPRKAE